MITLEKLKAQLKLRPLFLIAACVALLYVGSTSAQAFFAPDIHSYILYDDLSNTSHSGPGVNGDDDDEDDGRCDQGVGNGGEGCDPGKSGGIMSNDEGEGTGPGSPGAAGGVH